VEYFLTPKASGPYPPLDATVTYKAETGAKPQVRNFHAWLGTSCVNNI